MDRREEENTIQFHQILVLNRILLGVFGLVFDNAFDTIQLKRSRQLATTLYHRAAYIVRKEKQRSERRSPDLPRSVVDLNRFYFTFHFCSLFCAQREHMLRVVVFTLPIIRIHQTPFLPRHHRDTDLCCVLLSRSFTRSFCSSTTRDHLLEHY